MTFEPLGAAYLVAITAEAMTAALAAGRRRLDWFGVAVLGCVTALGGGSVRDILLGHHPLSWVRRPDYLLLTAGAALATIALARAMPRLRTAFLILDALGLAVFTVIGCQVALALGHGTTIVLVSGLVTGCAGGVLRDLLCGEVPLLLRRELYATVSLLAGGLYLLGRALGLHETALTLATMAAGLALRLLALHRQWHVPTFAYGEGSAGKDDAPR